MTPMVCDLCGVGDVEHRRRNIRHSASRYSSEISDRARRRAIRRVMAEPEPEYREPQMPTVRLVNIVLATLFLEVMVAMWGAPILVEWAGGLFR